MCEWKSEGVQKSELVSDRETVSNIAQPSDCLKRTEYMPLSVKAHQA